MKLWSSPMCGCPVYSLVIATKLNQFDCNCHRIADTKRFKQWQKKRRKENRVLQPIDHIYPMSWSRVLQMNELILSSVVTLYIYTQQECLKLVTRYSILVWSTNMEIEWDYAMLTVWYPAKSILSISIFFFYSNICFFPSIMKHVTWQICLFYDLTITLLT